MYVNNNNLTCFVSFGVEYIPKQIKKIIGNKNIIKNIYRIQAYDLIMGGYVCMGIIGFMLKGQSLLDSRNLLSPKEHEKMKKKKWEQYKTPQ